MRRSRTEHTAIYGYQNQPDDNGIYHINNGTDGVYQSNNVTEGIYHIPDDFIDSNNYMHHNNILHTKLYGEKGKGLLSIFGDTIKVSFCFYSVYFWPNFIVYLCRKNSNFVKTYVDNIWSKIFGETAWEN